MKIDREELARATEAGGWEKYKTFAKLSGPGWLQSAITLGGGSLAGSTLPWGNRRILHSLGAVTGDDPWGDHALCDQLYHLVHRSFSFRGDA